MSNAVERLIEAMHTACGPAVKTAAEWLTAAQSHDALSKALAQVFGQRPPSVKSLGRWLKERSGQDFGGLRLIAIYHSHLKYSQYVVETPAETQARERAEWNAEQRNEIIEAEKEQRAIARALRKHEEREAAEREAAEANAPGPTLPVEVSPREGDVITEADGNRYLIGRTTVDQQGQFRTERTLMPAKPDAVKPGGPRYFMFADDDVSDGLRGEKSNDGKRLYLTDYSETKREPYTWAIWASRDDDPFSPRKTSLYVRPPPEALRKPWTPGCGRPFTRADAIAQHKRNQVPGLPQSTLKDAVVTSKQYWDI